MKKKLLVFLLVGSMVLLPLFGCNKKDQTTKNDGQSTEDAGITEVDGKRYDSAGYLMDDLPEDLSFGGDEIQILHWSEPEIREFNPDESAVYAIDKAVYQRDRKVENRLDIEFLWFGIKGSYDHRNNFRDTVQTAYQSGEDSRYDIIAAYSQTAGMLAIGGLVKDMQSNKYLDLSKPWWPESLTESLTVSDKLFFASGDVSSTFLSQMISVYCNKGYFEDINLYDLVYNNEWTLEKMLELAEMKYVDVDQSGTKTQLDKYGVVVPWFVYLDGFFYGSNLITVDKDSEGELRVSNSYVGERADTVTEQLKTLFHGSDDGYHTNNVNTIDIFARGDAAFMVAPGVTVLTRSTMQETDVDYGVLPMPKYNSQQAKYKTVITNLFSLYSIFAGSTQEQVDRAGAVLECMGSEGYRTLTPVLFNECLQLRYTKDGDTGKMYDIIRDGVVFDVGRVYAISLDSITQNDWQLTVIYNDGVWGAKAGSVDAKLQKLLDSLQETINNLQETDGE